MRHNKEFLPTEWRSQRQVANFFGRLSTCQRHAELETPQVVTEQDEEDMWDQEDDRRHIRNAVFNALDIGHPLVYEEYDLCQLAKKNKLSQLKLTCFASICAEFGIEPVGTKSRKASFIKPLRDFIKQCSCYV